MGGYKAQAWDGTSTHICHPRHRAHSSTLELSLTSVGMKNVLGTHVESNVFLGRLGAREASAIPCGVPTTKPLLPVAEEVTHELSLGWQAHKHLGSSIPGRGVSLGKTKAALSVGLGLWLVVSFNPHTAHGTTEGSTAEHLPSRSSWWGASQGHSASGSYCLRSLSLLKVFQECGGLTHSLPWVHSLKFIKPLPPLVILIQIPAHKFHRWSWQEESWEAFFCSGCESIWRVWEIQEQSFTKSQTPVAGAG